jgi:hypothetical protein
MTRYAIAGKPTVIDSRRQPTGDTMAQATILRGLYVVSIFTFSPIPIMTATAQSQHLIMINKEWRHPGVDGVARFTQVAGRKMVSAFTCSSNVIVARYTSLIHEHTVIHTRH